MKNKPSNNIREKLALSFAGVLLGVGVTSLVAIRGQADAFVRRDCAFFDKECNELATVDLIEEGRVKGNNEMEEYFRTYECMEYEFIGKSWQVPRYITYDLYKCKRNIKNYSYEEWDDLDLVEYMSE